MLQSFERQPFAEKLQVEVTIQWDKARGPLEGIPEGCAWSRSLTLQRPNQVMGLNFGGITARIYNDLSGSPIPFTQMFWLPLFTRWMDHLWAVSPKWLLSACLCLNIYQKQDWKSQDRYKACQFFCQNSGLWPTKNITEKIPKHIQSRMFVRRQRLRVYNSKWKYEKISVLKF